MQVRRRLSMREAAKEVDSKALQHRLDMHGGALQHRLGMPVGTEEPQLPAATQSRAVTQLLSMKARYEQRTEANEEVCGYLRQLPDDQTAEPLGELYFRLTQLMREVEHLHGMHGQEPAPWLLLCKDGDLLNTDGYADRPTGYDKVYVDLMQTYRNAARTAMSVADTAGRVASPHGCSGVGLENCTAAGVRPLYLQRAERRPETAHRDYGS